MCGIAGFIQKNILKCDIESNVTIKLMTDQIINRGPNGYGFWNDSEFISLGHRRLSIIDLTESGKQPMVSKSGRYVITFNGEIYNYLELRHILDSSGSAPAWNGHSDTEVLLECFSLWGIKNTLQKCVGMFAIAVWDILEKKLFLARDRVGEKPLYYGWQGTFTSKSFLFASDLNALKVHPSFNASINKESVALLMKFNYIPAPHSIYEGIYKLEPGHIFTYDISKELYTNEPYWQLEQIRNTYSSLSSNSKSYVDTLHDLLKTSVKRQMISDVPLGAFLSGGIDSSLIVSIMQSLSNKKIKTFSIGFNENDYNEAHHADQIAKYLGTDHTELYVSSKDAMDVIPKLPTIFSEPFSDSSQIPTYLVSHLAKQSVTVSLSGDAGDELFGGYNRYIHTDTMWRFISLIPQFIKSYSRTKILSILQKISQKYNVSEKNIKLFHRLEKGIDLINSSDIEVLYSRMTTHWTYPHDLVLDTKNSLPYKSSVNLQHYDNIEYMMINDFLNYLPNDILVKVDRAAMSVGLETRIPFLDHNVIEFAFNLPKSLKIRNGTSKWILREILNQYIPKQYFKRPKMGFGIPIEHWLRGPLRSWAENLLLENKIKSDGIFNYEIVKLKWNEHINHKNNWHYHLWDILMFQAWLDENKSSK